MIDLIVMYLFLVASVILGSFAMKYLEKIQNIAKKNQQEAKKYGSDLVTGIVSGCVVLVLDRIITPMFNAKFSFVTSSAYDFILSAAGVIIILFFEVSLLLFLIFYIIYKGMNKK